MCYQITDALVITISKKNRINDKISSKFVEHYEYFTEFAPQNAVITLTLN